MKTSNWDIGSFNLGIYYKLLVKLYRSCWVPPTTRHRTSLWPRAEEASGTMCPHQRNKGIWFNKLNIGTHQLSFGHKNWIQKSYSPLHKTGKVTVSFSYEKAMILSTLYLQLNRTENLACFSRCVPWVSIFLITSESYSSFYILRTNESPRVSNGNPLNRC